MTTAPADGMPSTRGTNFYLADANLAFVCTAVMPADDLARARPHLIAMGEVAGGELDALAAVADRNPPARLVRDAYLGAIWEGATNVVALDMQRAILRAAAFEPLAALVRARLDRVSEPRAKRWSDAVAGTLAELRRRVAAWPGLGAADLELDARPVADALYHALAGALLLAESQALWQECGSARKLLAGARYVKTWLRPPAPPASAFTAAECAWLPALVDGTTVPAEALAEPAGGR